jgi:hypothetical protein
LPQKIAKYMATHNPNFRFAAASRQQGTKRRRDMKDIKTRSRGKDIKVLDKSVNLSKRMKDAFVRTKDLALSADRQGEETQNPQSATPVDYATERIGDTAQEVIRTPQSPRPKARKRFERAQDHFRDVSRNLPKERRRAAEHAQKAARKTKSSAETLRKSADQAKETAAGAKTAVTDAKRTWQEVRHAGRPKIRDAKQAARGGYTRPAEYGGAAHFPGPSDAAPRDMAAPRNPPKKRPPDATPAQRGLKPETPGRSAGAKPAQNNVPRPDTGAAPRRGIYRNANTRGETAAAKGAGRAAESTKKGFKKTAKGTIKTAKKSAKTAEKSAKAAVKTAKQAAKAAQKSAKAAVKAAKMAERAARAAAKAAAYTAKIAAKAIIATVKALIAAVKGLVSLIAAGGWVAVVIILIVCIIALLAGSVFGIFFSGEDSGSGCTMPMAVAEINTEYADKIGEIKANNPHDAVSLSGSRADWEDILAVYAVKTAADPGNGQDVAAMDEGKKALLQSVFWDMNAITYRTGRVTETKTTVTDDGAGHLVETEETVIKTVLYISVSGKTAAEMAEQYRFNDEQKARLAELLSDEYAELWAAVLYGA